MGYCQPWFGNEPHLSYHELTCCLTGQNNPCTSCVVSFAGTTNESRRSRFVCWSGSSWATKDLFWKPSAHTARKKVCRYRPMFFISGACLESGALFFLHKCFQTHFACLFPFSSRGLGLLNSQVEGSMSQLFRLVFRVSFYRYAKRNNVERIRFCGKHVHCRTTLCVCLYIVLLLSESRSKSRHSPFDSF